jgi:putative FmdB family regulatory protein
MNTPIIYPCLFLIEVVMPIYEYQCPFCNHQLEILQKMSDEPPECPHCKKTGLRRLVSAAGFQLKGTGWYATDYRHKGKAKETDDKKADDSTTNPDTVKENDKSSKVDKPKDDKKSSSSTETSSGDKTGG